jgi:tRNA1(Val) A37 N6-methylase TrmN6
VLKKNLSVLKKKKKEKEHFLQQDKGAFWFTKDSLILSASDTKYFYQ